MAYQSNNPRRKKKQAQSGSTSPLILLITGLLVVLIGLAVILRLVSGGPAKPAQPEPTKAAIETTVEAEAPEEPEAPEETKPEKVSFWDKLFKKNKSDTEKVEETKPEAVHQISSATLLATGDVLMHKPVYSAGLKPDGSYDLNFLFKYISPIVSRADYAVANLETTLAGTNNGFPYSGYPNFNCPDEVVDAAKAAGFDMFLTANNHCYDTGEVGFLRTVQTVREKGMDALGTMASASDPKYLIKDLNGIKVGMICYTYEQPTEDPIIGRVYLNHVPMMEGAENLINTFLPSNLEPFYREIEGYINEMKQAGADATVVFMHWGTEYETTPNGDQRIIAQKLADMGVDAIIGGHPHVVQQMDMLASRLDPDHKTVCLYSMGNAVSNQRIAEMDLKTGHTEDGVLFQLTFCKYSDGTVYLDGVELIPTWVDLRNVSVTEYDIIPLDYDRLAHWQSDFDLNATGYTNAQSSYERTMDIVGKVLARTQDFLTQRKLQREEDYLAAFEAR